MKLANKLEKKISYSFATIRGSKKWNIFDGTCCIILKTRMHIKNKKKHIWMHTYTNFLHCNKKRKKKQ